MEQVPDANAVPGLSASALRFVRRLANRRGRELARKFVVEGPQGVEAALKHPGFVEQVIVDDPDHHRELLAGHDVPIRLATPAQLKQLSDTVTPQGILAVCSQFDNRLEDIHAPSLVVICAQVRDPGNAGSIIRSADAFGADAVVLTEGSVELYNPKTVRSTAGSLFNLPIITGVPLARAASIARSKGMQVLAADGNGVQLDALAAQGGLGSPTAWMMGNEAWGIPPEDVELADLVVAVPMWGAAESLNLSNAAAICLYQTASAQRRSYEE